MKPTRVYGGNRTHDLLVDQPGHTVLIILKQVRQLGGLHVQIKNGNRHRRKI